MRTNLTSDDRALLDRYVESVLLRFSDGRYDLAETTQELSEAFARVARGEPDYLDHMRGMVEAGDDA
jgi:hypothetical protein